MNLARLFRQRVADSCYQRFLLKFRLTHQVTLPIRLNTTPAFSLKQIGYLQQRKMGSFFHGAKPTGRFLLGSDGIINWRMAEMIPAMALSCAPTLRSSWASFCASSL